MISWPQHLASKLLHFDLDIGTFHLAKCLRVRHCHHNRCDFGAHCEFASINGSDTVDYERLPRRKIKSFFTIWFAINFCDPAENESTDRHVLLKFVVGHITQLVESGSHGALVTDLDEATGLPDIGHIANCQIALSHCNGCSVLQYLITEVACILSLLVQGHEVLGGG